MSTNVRFVPKLEEEENLIFLDCAPQKRSFDLGKQKISLTHCWRLFTLVAFKLKVKTGVYQLHIFPWGTLHCLLSFCNSMGITFLLSKYVPRQARAFQRVEVVVILQAASSTRSAASGSGLSLKFSVCTFNSWDSRALSLSSWSSTVEQVLYHAVGESWWDRIEWPSYGNKKLLTPFINTSLQSGERVDVLGRLENAGMHTKIYRLLENKWKSGKTQSDWAFNFPDLRKERLGPKTSQDSLLIS